jgi:hypothetical protein
MIVAAAAVVIMISVDTQNKGQTCWHVITNNC